MKPIHQFAGCSAVMLAMTWSGCAAEPQKAPASDARPQPVMTAPTTSGTNVAARPSPFSAEISADFMKKVMETSAKIEAAKRQIAERQAKLYETNPDIKSTRALMIEGQKEINRILDADPELAELKMSRDLLWSIMPVLPKTREPASMPRMPSTR